MPSDDLRRRIAQVVRVTACAWGLPTRPFRAPALLLFAV
ncbi:hypothetical protein SAMN05444747_115116 [Variovorax sp. OV329]|nr:hypothetical protein SAMN05444747_115116 [Variovorax sp. OV329]